VPKKTIYVSEEDIPIFQEAMQKFGGEESMSSVIVDALREKLRDRRKEEEEVLNLVLALECSPPAIFAECVERKLRDFPEDVVARSRLAAEATYESDPDFFNERGYWELISNEEAWLEEAREKVVEGVRLLRERYGITKLRMPEEIAAEDNTRLHETKTKLETLFSELESLGKTKETEQ
jgi:hypothetical protein